MMLGSLPASIYGQAPASVPVEEPVKTEQAAETGGVEVATEPEQETEPENIPAEEPVREDETTVEAKEPAETVTTKDGEVDVQYYLEHKIPIPESVSGVTEPKKLKASNGTVTYVTTVSNGGSYCAKFKVKGNSPINEDIINEYKGYYNTCSNWINNNLTSITIPNSVTLISAKAFYRCINLSTINFNGTKSQWSSVIKNLNWSSGIKATYVTCTDGTVAI